jgi:hypothetical protein
MRFGRNRTHGRPYTRQRTKSDAVLRCAVTIVFVTVIASRAIPASPTTLQDVGGFQRLGAFCGKVPGLWAYDRSGLGGCRTCPGPARPRHTFDPTSTRPRVCGGAALAGSVSSSARVGAAKSPVAPSGPTGRIANINPYEIPDRLNGHGRPVCSKLDRRDRFSRTCRSLCVGAGS